MSRYIPVPEPKHDDELGPDDGYYCGDCTTHPFVAREDIAEHDRFHAGEVETPPESLVEVCARALWEAEGAHIVPWPGKDGDEIDIYYDDARTVLKAALLHNGAGEVETPCATCHGERTILSAHWGNAPVSRVPCPDCGVETPEAAVEAIRRELVVIERIATKRGPAHRLDLANIALMVTRARLELDRLAQGWTPPGTED